jgi:hypothetical protein
MTTDKKPRKGTIAHYRARVAELANENAALKSAAYDATVGELVCQMRATIATERAEQAERERDGETARADGLATQNAALWSAVNDASTGALMFQARADGLARRLARVRDLLAFTRGRLSMVRISRDEYRASAGLGGGLPTTGAIWRPPTTPNSTPRRPPMPLPASVRRVGGAGDGAPGEAR